MFSNIIVNFWFQMTLKESLCFTTRNNVNEFHISILIEEITGKIQLFKKCVCPGIVETFDDYCSIRNDYDDAY